MARSRKTRVSQWRKSTVSGADNCVEVALCNTGPVHVRDSKDPGGAILTFTATEWDAFVAGVRNGEFDRGQA